MGTTETVVIGVFASGCVILMVIGVYPDVARDLFFGFAMILLRDIGRRKPKRRKKRPPRKEQS